MKYNIQILKILILIIMIIALESCTDIVNSDANIIKEYTNPGTDTTNPNSTNIYFRYDLFSLNYAINDTTLLWPIKQPSGFGRTFNVVNTDSLENYVVNSISLEDGDYFEVSSLLPLPYILTPKTVSTKQEFIVILKTENLKKGIYIDKIIINKNKDIGYYIRVNVQ